MPSGGKHRKLARCNIQNYNDCIRKFINTQYQLLDVAPLFLPLIPLSIMLPPLSPVHVPLTPLVLEWVPFLLRCAFGGNSAALTFSVAWCGVHSVSVVVRCMVMKGIFRMTFNL